MNKYCCLPIKRCSIQIEHLFSLFYSVFCCQLRSPTTNGLRPLRTISQHRFNAGGWWTICKFQHRHSLRRGSQSEPPCMAKVFGEANNPVPRRESFSRNEKQDQYRRLGQTSEFIACRGFSANDLCMNVFLWLKICYD